MVPREIESTKKRKKLDYEVFHMVANSIGISVE